MKKLLYAIFAGALFVIGVKAQATPAPSPTPNMTTASKSEMTAESKPKRKNFRANQEQVTQAQKMLKVAETGKSDATTKTAVNARYTTS